MSNYQSLVETKLAPVSNFGDDVVYQCPLCESETSSGHLYVNYEKNKFNCFKCELGGKDIRLLLKVLSIDVSYDYEALYNDYNKELDDIIAEVPTNGNKILEYSRDLSVLKQYYDYHRTPLSLVARQYLHNRGFTDKVIEDLQLCEGVNRYKEEITLKGTKYYGRDYSGRVLVPSLYKGGISFYVARDYTGRKSNKYLNPPKTLAYSSEDVWNLDVVQSHSVIVCEGVFTAATVVAGSGKMNAVATYGKSISFKSNSDINVTSQGEKLLNKKFHTYYIAYDADALNNSLDACEYLYERGADVRLVYIDPKIYGEKADINDIGYEEFLKLMGHSIVYDKFTRLIIGL